MKETFVLIGIAVPLMALYWAGRRQRKWALARWASSHGLTIVRCEQPVLTELSPFPVTASKAQQIFRIIVQDVHGDQRSGWIRLGSVWRGLASPRVEVRWQ